MALNSDQRGAEKGKVGIIKKVFSGKILSCANSRQNVALPEEDLDYIARTTAINRDQVEAQFQKFIRIHPDGNISKRSFSEMMQECYPGADTEKLSRHIWRMYDTNKDGHIDFKEFMIVLYVMSNGSPEENLRQIFRVFDINNDGRISVTELKRIVKDLFHLLNEGDAEAASQEILVKSAFSEMDENDDGEITQDEFIKACMEQKKFSTMLTLKIINVFLADNHVRESRESSMESVKKSQNQSEKSKSKKQSKDTFDKASKEKLRKPDSTSLTTEDLVMRKKGPPVRQCTSASSVETRSRQETATRGGSGREDAMETSRRLVEPMVVSAHKLQIENKKHQGGDRTPNMERKQSGRKKELDKQQPESSSSFPTSPKNNRAKAPTSMEPNWHRSQVKQGNEHGNGQVSSLETRFSSQTHGGSGPEAGQSVPGDQCVRQRGQTLQTGMTTTESGRGRSIDKTSYGKNVTKGSTNLQ